MIYELTKQCVKQVVMVKAIPRNRVYSDGDEATDGDGW